MKHIGSGSNVKGPKIKRKQGYSLKGFQLHQIVHQTLQVLRNELPPKMEDVEDESLNDVLRTIQSPEDTYVFGDQSFIQQPTWNSTLLLAAGICWSRIW